MDHSEGGRSLYERLGSPSHSGCFNCGSVVIVPGRTARKDNTVANSHLSVGRLRIDSEKPAISTPQFDAIFSCSQGREDSTQRRASDSPPPVPFPQASVSPTHAAPQHQYIILDQRIKPCWKNRLTLRLWRESPDSERKSSTIPPSHHQGF